VIVLDASVLIAQFEGNDVHHGRAVKLLSDAAGDEFAASPLTLAEALVQPTRQGRADDARAGIHRLAVRTIPLDDAAPTRLAELRVSTGLKLPDCCVLLAAERAGADVATFDEDLASAAGQAGLSVRRA
jgi:predicted nucleic acid-binding protein